MASHALLALCLLLAAGTATTTATAAAGGASHRRLQQLPKLGDPAPLPKLGGAAPLAGVPMPPLPPKLGDPAPLAGVPMPPLPKLGGAGVPIPSTMITGCWKSVLASESCVHDILQSLVFFDVRISKACCSELVKAGDKCVLEVFSGFPFNPFYPPLVKRICRLAA